MRSVYAWLKKSGVGKSDRHSGMLGVRFDCMLRIMSTRVGGELGDVVNFTKEQTEAISKKCGRDLRSDDYLPIYKIIEMGFTPSQVVWALLNSGVSPTFALTMMEYAVREMLDAYDRERNTAWAKYLSDIRYFVIPNIINNKLPPEYCNKLSKKLQGKRKKLLKYPRDKRSARRLCEDVMIRQLLAVYWYIKYRDFGDKYRKNFIQAAAFTMVFSPVISMDKTAWIRGNNPNGSVIIELITVGLLADELQREEQEQYVAGINPSLLEQ